MAKFIYIPCGHFGICESCKNKMEQSESNIIHQGCPFCKNISSKFIKFIFVVKNR